MKQKEIREAFENLTSNRYLFIGENLNLNEEILNSLLQIGFERFYLINPSSVISNYITNIVDKESLTIAKNISELALPNEIDVCLLGFPPISNDVFRKFKNIKGNILVFFEEEIGSFKNLWIKAFKNIKIIELQLSLFFSSRSNIILYTEKLDKTAPEFFTNRGNEIDAYRTFVHSSRHRAAKIVGLDGIGKKAFLNYLKTFHNLDNNCFEFYFTSGENTLFDVIYELGKYLSVKILDKEISSIKKDNTPSSILRLFEKFDKIKDVKIIFRNINLVYDVISNEFYDKQLGIFLHNLITRNSYAGNRIYFVANIHFTLPLFQSDELCFTISLPAINSRFIKIIMEREFIQLSKQVLATRIMQLDEDVIFELINGHPHVAKMFVKACDNASIDTIINDSNFRKKFEDDKVRYLFDVITLNSTHVALEYLNYFSCVNGKFDNSLIEEVCTSDKAETIIYLRNRFFLEVEYHENKSESYEVPILVRKFIRSRISKGLYKSINNSLGEYFWKIANDFKSSTFKMIRAYRESEFHFIEADNAEMQKN